MSSREKKKVSWEDEVFEIRKKKLPRKSWLWWFWLFFLDDSSEVKKPRQLMILWSKKKENRISCNDLEIELDHNEEDGKLHGAVAAWYFDGEEMKHNFLLEQCDLNFENNRLWTDSNSKTSFSVKGDESEIKIGEEFCFKVKHDNSSKFQDLRKYSNKYIGNKGYSMLRSNRNSLEGKIGQEKVKGSAYFQRVFINAPAPPWYWGIFHFENGASLTYYNPSLFGISLKRDISFFDGKEVHNFEDIKVKRTGGEIPEFRIEGKEKGKEIRFKVESYSKSSWKFRKKLLNLIPNKLTYREYPSKITEFDLEDKSRGEKIGLEQLGSSIGNAEHTTGLLL